jgi:hypothetical protein
MPKRKANQSRTRWQQVLENIQADQPSIPQYCTSIPESTLQTKMSPRTQRATEPSKPFQPTCMEHFHNPLCDMAEVRPCESKFHGPHYVCSGCMRAARKVDMVGYRTNQIIERGATAPLCRTCSTSVAQSIGLEFDSCTCPSSTESISKPWLCMDCMYTMAWRAGLAKTDYDMSAYGKRATWHPNASEGTCQSGCALCPFCRNEFTEGKQENAVAACLGCHGLIIHLTKQKTKPNDQTIIPAVMFSLPSWTVRSIGHARPSMEEYVAPDFAPIEETVVRDLCPAQIDSANALQDIRTAGAPPHNLLPREWNFPRNPTAHLSARPTTHTAYTSSELRNIKEIVKLLSPNPEYDSRNIMADIMEAENQEAVAMTQAVSKAQTIYRQLAGVKGIVEDRSASLLVRGKCGSFSTFMHAFGISAPAPALKLLLLRT